MLILVDARTAFAPQPRGIGKTLISLYRALAAVRSEWRFIMLHRSISGRDPFETVSNIKCIHTDFVGDRWNLWEHIWLPMKARALRPDMMHCPANSAPRCCPVPFVTTVHDLIPMHRPNFGDAHRWLAQTRRAAHGAIRVVTPSTFSKTEIIRELRIDPEKVSVVPWAAQVHRTVVNPQTVYTTLRRHGVTAANRYVLSFGAADPRKNTHRLMEAWAKLSSSLRASCHLLVVGVEPEALPTFRALARQLSIDDSCTIGGFASEEDLPVLINGAMALCYLSVSEGFGLPILDAFSCAVPVVAGNATSIPEVAGDASLLVDPFCIASITSGLCRLLEDEPLRKQLACRGFERSMEFNWQHSAELMASTLEEARMEVYAAL